MDKAFEHFQRSIFGLSNCGSSDNFHSVFKESEAKYTTLKQLLVDLRDTLLQKM